MFLFCVLVQNGRVSLAKRGNLACPAGAQEGRHLRFPPSCESPLSLGESGADCRHVTAAKYGERQRIFSSVSFSTCSQCQIPFCYTGGFIYAVGGMTVPPDFFARYTARHLRIRRLILFIFAGTVYHNALSNCAALLCRTQRRVARMCSRTLSDPANRLRKTRKKKSSVVPLFRSGHMSAICARLRNKGKRELRG